MSEDEAAQAAGDVPTADGKSRFGARWVVLATVSVLVLALALLAGWALSIRGSGSPRAVERVPTTRESDPVGVGGNAVQRTADLAELPTGPVEHVELAYFHRTQRCRSCIEAERLVRKTVDTFFADEVERGRVSLVVADVEAPENADLVRTYDAWTSSLYLGVTKGGVLHVVSVADMWLEISDEERFTESLRAKLEAILGSA